MIAAEPIYTTRFATNRAINRREDPSAWECVPGPDGKGYTIAPAGTLKSERKAKTKATAVTHANPTRAAEAKRAHEKAEAKKTAKAANGHKAPGGKRAEILASAQAGKVPAVPDFSAETHKRFRPKLAELVALVKAGDVKGLKSYPINPISTSPKAMDRYRNLAVIALEAQAKG